MFEFLIQLVESEQQRYKTKPSAYKKEKENFFVNVGKMPEDPKSRVNYWMAYAIKSIVGSLPKIPSTENPIRIKNSSALESQYVWTSLMLLGSILPDKFDHHAIWVLSANGFAPGSEIGYFSRFSSKSLYETTFKRYIDEVEINAFLTKASPIITKLLAEEKKIVDTTIPSESFNNVPSQTDTPSTSFSNINMQVLGGFIAALGMAAVAIAFVALNAATLGLTGLIVAGIGAVATLGGIGLFAAGTTRKYQSQPYINDLMVNS
ncbi:hypothetical protein [Legionella sp.]|uniref:hypothetical protein n=1 Tax=Legionella sp. TaxID=459 RepID=UPI003CA2DF42